jgi:regulation of enolase protein 1 (concanavalin A-like superfamily)
VSWFQIRVLGLVLLLPLLNAVSAEKPAIDGVPTSLAWQNIPAVWHVEHGAELTILSGKETDWFVDPFDGTVHNTAPMLLFTPAGDYVFRAKVKVGFNTKWDAGALMVWAGDHNWAKLSFELSPAKQPTMVTVVTRGLSDDCNFNTNLGQHGLHRNCQEWSSVCRMSSIHQPMGRAGRC